MTDVKTSIYLIKPNKNSDLIKRTSTFTRKNNHVFKEFFYLAGSKEQSQINLGTLIIVTY